MAKLTIIEKEGLTFERHDVAINKGKTPIGFVEVFATKSFEELADGVGLGFETEKHACELYTSAKTIEMQRQARSAKTGGKIPSDTFARIFATLSIDDKQKPWSVVQSIIDDIYRVEST